jgi:hypothetical protein
MANNRAGVGTGLDTEATGVGAILAAVSTLDPFECPKGDLPSQAPLVAPRESVFSVSFLREGEALSDESDPATYSIHHIFPSMTEERGTGKITNVPLLAFCFIDLTEAPKKGRLLFFTEAVQNPSPGSLCEGIFAHQSWCAAQDIEAS